MRLDCDLVEIMLACVENRLPEVEVKLKDETTLCVVMAAGGYPGSYEKGAEISGFEEAEKIEGVKVFQAGTKFEDGKTVTSGGRVLGVTALGADLGAAQKKAYEAVEKISFDKAYFRRDIGDKGLKK